VGVADKTSRKEPCSTSLRQISRQDQVAQPVTAMIKSRFYSFPENTALFSLINHRGHLKETICLRQYRVHGRSASALPKKSKRFIRLLRQLLPVNRSLHAYCTSIQPLAQPIRFRSHLFVPFGMLSGPNQSKPCPPYLFCTKQSHSTTIVHL
jgi:hypothetical protein